MATDQNIFREQGRWQPPYALWALIGPLKRPLLNRHASAHKGGSRRATPVLRPGSLPVDIFANVYRT